MTNTKKITYLKIRNFSQKLNATLEFIRQNYKSLGKSIIYILGPMAILNGILFMKYVDFALGNIAAQDPTEIQNPFSFIASPSYLGFIALSTFSTVVNFSIIFNFMKIYNIKYPEEITVTEVLNASWPDLMKLLLLGLVATFMISLGLIAFVIPGIYLMIVLSISIPVLFFEDLSTYDSISRSFKLIKGKWWSTFSLLFVASVLMYAVSMIFIMPFYIFYFISAFSSMEEVTFSVDISSSWFRTGLSLSAILMILGSFVTYSIPMIALSFQYFNLAERQKSLE